QLVVVRSLTKFYAIAGLRVGFALAHPDLLARWQQWRDPWSVNGLASVGAIAALGDREFQQRTYAWLPPSRQRLFAQLQAIGCDPLPGAANFLLVRSPVSVAALQRELLQSDRILIRTCHSFARDGSFGEQGDRWFRLAVRTPQENDSLIEALTRAISRLQQTGLSVAE
ncbi:MAG: aminotransferase class I/II-fold pyridoxal phosphate-dependent enzyme, partial [Cyanobacteria bacterium J06639_1]